MKKRLIVTQVFFLCACFVSEASAHEQKKLDSSKNVGTSENVSGYIDSDADIEGVTIINDKVFIDGQEVQRGRTIFVSKKTKKRYMISWKKNDPVVSELK